MSRGTATWIVCGAITLMRAAADKLEVTSAETPAGVVDAATDLQHTIGALQQLLDDLSRLTLAETRQP
jgi:hypothetical protein